MCNWYPPTQWGCGCVHLPRFLAYCPEQVATLIHMGEAARCPPNRPWQFTNAMCPWHYSQFRVQQQAYQQQQQEYQQRLQEYHQRQHEHQRWPQEQAANTLQGVSQTEKVAEKEGEKQAEKEGTQTKENEGGTDSSEAPEKQEKSKK